MNIQHPAQTGTGHQVSTPYSLTALAPPSFPSRPGTSILLDDCSKGSLEVDNYARCWTSQDIRNRCQRFLITINVLPDDVLLEIFDFLLSEEVYKGVQEWIRLTRVCRRWRSVVFQSPLRLNLQLVCTSKTRVKDTLDIWPPLPLIIDDNIDGDGGRPGRLGADNIIAALEHNDRVCRIKFFWFSSPELEYVTNSAAMQNPFPKLTSLDMNIHQVDEADEGPILPDSFSGGTAPRLRSLDLTDVPFPGLPKLLLSATHLVHLSLGNIPRSGYIPPEAMATSLSALTNLEFLCLRFRYPRPRPALESRRPPPPPLTRPILPSLTRFYFKGASEYLEEIVARIDAPRLGRLDITFFNEIIFDTPQLFQFISRTPTLMTPNKGVIMFSPVAVSIISSLPTSGYTLRVAISCTGLAWQLSAIEQVFTSSLPPLSTLETLSIINSYQQPCWEDDVENSLWLDLLRSFVAVKELYFLNEIVPRIVPALQELVGGRTTEVLPSLEKIFWKGFQSTGPIREGVERFVAARLLTSHPVVLFRWDEQRNLYVPAMPTTS